MSRVDAEAQRLTLEAENTPHALIAFLTIEHPALATPIRVVSDVMAYQVGSVVFEGIPFGIKQLTDNESGPRTQITIQNLDRRIGEALRRSDTRAKVRLDVRSSADFNLSVDPRTEIATTAPIYSFAFFELVNVEGDVAQLVGDVELQDYSVEPWPNVRATQDRLPGLFR
jgi:hypothetical protein